MRKAKKEKETANE